MMKKRILTFLLVLILMYNAALQVSAAQFVPNLSDSGSITFEMVKNGTLLDGGSLSLCKVGDIQEDNGDYSFVLIAELKGSDVDLRTPTNPDVAEKLLILAKKHNLTARNAPIVKGKTNFPELPVGLYLVWQDEGNATEGFLPIQPFLISIPKREGNQYIQDIVAKPKVSLETESTEPTTPPPSPPPPPPYLPDTGQLNWPIPVMAILGCVLFALGLLLYSGRKGIDNEA